MKIITILICLLTLSCAHTEPRQLSVPETLQEDRLAIVQLESALAGCTGFHIGDGIIVSAAHCHDLFSVLMGIKLEVISADGNKQVPEILVVSWALDLLVLKVKVAPPGRLDLEENPNNLFPGDELLTIGYPLYMEDQLGFDVGRFKTMRLYKGRTLMLTDVSSLGYSGGPVINLRTNKVVGIQHKMYNKSDKLGDDPDKTQPHWLGLTIPVQDLLGLLEKNKIKWRPDDP